MAENYSFFNSKDHDRRYNARHWADYFFPLFKSGVFNGDLQVVENGGMAVKIKSGYAWIDGYGYHLTDGLPLDLETASGNMNRMDSIVIRLDLTNRWIKAFCKTGSYYAGTPTPPAPEITATIHEIVIAHISVVAGVTEITQDMITDTRMDGNLCGWVCGTVNEIKFDQITEQFKAFMKRYENNLDAKFEDLETYEANKKNEFDTFQTELTEKEQIMHDQHKAELKAYFSQMEKEGNANLLAITQQLIDFRNENELEFLAWVEEMKNILGEGTAGELLIKINALTNQIEEMEQMLLSGSVLAKLLTDDGKCLTDDMGNPLLAEFPICKCVK